MASKRFKQIKLTIKSLKCHDTNDTFMTGKKDEIVIYTTSSSGAKPLSGHSVLWPKGKAASFKKGQKKDIDKTVTFDFEKEDRNFGIEIIEIDTDIKIPNIVDFESDENDFIGSIGFINVPTPGMKPFYKATNKTALSGKTTFEKSGSKYTLKWSIDDVTYWDTNPDEFVKPIDLN